MASALTTATLTDRIVAALNEAPYKPWCVHRLYEELIPASVPSERDGLLLETQHAADALVQA
ncbi:MAG: hypothetical protein L3J91_02015, partial [Thermoplasmata archaeon]|nr:hypothetical protein [Thermoplasmata archaeon]